MAKDITKLPPQNTEAEQIVLGSLLIDKEAITKVADFLLPHDFYSPIHEKIYEAIIDLYSHSKPIDLMSVNHHLKEKGLLKSVGGSSYLSEMVNMVPTSSHVTHYGRIVHDKKVLRDLIRLSAEATEQALQSDKNTEELLDDVEKRIFSLSQISIQKALIPLREDLKAAYDRIEKLHKGEDALRGVTTGFKQLDDLLSGLQKSDLVILGARPSLGKTSFALDIARNAAKAGHSIGIFSLEMSREQVVDRLISSESQVSLWKIRTGRINDDLEFEMIQHALGKLSEYKISIDDTASPNIMQMRAMGRRLQSERGLDLLIIDYLQLIVPRTSSESMVQQVTEISRGLKALARELNIPVLALSQLSRGIESRDHKIPRLADLRESGSIEQDADVVMFIYRKDRDKDREELSPEEQNVAQIIVAKHRNGPLGTVDLRFDSERASFRTIDRKFDEPDL
ncbi:MAG: replicative DNA helicase [Anaplasmataceae bacterium]|nr:replicative DNA helicase [Anaplasmataceae bacterium]